MYDVIDFYDLNTKVHLLFNSFSVEMKTVFNAMETFYELKYGSRNVEVIDLTNPFIEKMKRMRRTA